MVAKKLLIEQLQREVLQMQGYRRPQQDNLFRTGLGPIEASFPDKRFPAGVVHDFASGSQEDATATIGFVAGLMTALMRKDGRCLWISNRRTLFPAALERYHIPADRIIFIDLSRPKEVLWTIEEALKCNVLSTVVGELRDLGFTESRRLQLAVEQSHVTGFILRMNNRSNNPVACAASWKIKPLASISEEGMPGLGYPRWLVQLTKVRNGKPGEWELSWRDGAFAHSARSESLVDMQQLEHKKAV